jgi:protoporphyrinogen oxidase
MAKSVAIIGGGISGLSAAHFALQKGYAVDLFEKDAQWGGLAASFDLGGIPVEKYYHFICGGDVRLIALARELGLEAKLQFRPTRTSNFVKGKLYPFSTPTDLLKFRPISLLSRLRFGLNIALSKIRRTGGALDDVPARDWLLRRIGRSAYEAVWEPLLKIKFGPFYDRVSAAWIWHRIHRAASSRRGLFAREKMGYFEGGSRILIEALVKSIAEKGGRLRLETEVRGIEKRDNGAFRLEGVGPDSADYAKIVLALPLPVAAAFLAGLSPAYAQELGHIPFLAIVCGVFRLKQKVTEAFWLNINDPAIPSSGFIEYTNLNPLREIAPDHLLYIPFYVEADDPFFTTLDAALLRGRLFAMIQAVHPGLTPDDIVDFRLFKNSHAQAICEIGFSDHKPPFLTPVPNVYLLDSTQLYPADRNLSGLIANAERLIASGF